MGRILGLGMTHYPGLHMLDEDMWVFLRLTLSGKKVPERVRDPGNWPREMRAEWGNDDGARAGRIHRERCLAATRVLRARLDAFEPDVVLIFSDDQYENFVEDIVPPFCVFAVDEMVDAGQHEMLNWVTLAGAMSDLGRKAELVDWVESYVMNSNKCFAAFPA